MDYTENDEMSEAFVKLDPDLKIGSMVKTGICLRVTNRQTGKPANGVQLNNTTLEIESLPEVKVEVVGYSQMYEALDKIRGLTSNSILYSIADKALEAAEQKG